MTLDVERSMTEPPPGDRGSPDFICAVAIHLTDKFIAAGENPGGIPPLAGS